MRRHVLVARLGSDDDADVATATDEVVTPVRLVSADSRLDYGIGNALDALTKLQVYPSEMGIDVAVLAALVHAADTRISRRSESQDSWTREIRIVTPVSDPSTWFSAKLILERMLSFLTGDRWTIDFRPRPGRMRVLARARPADVTTPFDSISLFSGGVDSLVGATDMLAAGRLPLLVSHAGEGATSRAQLAAVTALKKAYSSSTFGHFRTWMVFPKGLVRDVEPEDTTRGRSFLFIALGVLAGSGCSTPFVLAVPENGLIALNVPLDRVRLGSLSTRTTHPFYLSCWNDLLTQLGINGRTENPYWSRTKGEMVAECLNGALLRDVMPATVSCSSASKARWIGRGNEHCGFCLPCLIRRAAIESAWGQGADLTPYTLADLKARPLTTREAEGRQIRSFQMAISRLHARPELAELMIHKPGPLPVTRDELRGLADVYRRGLNEVGALLTGVVTESS